MTFVKAKWFIYTVLVGLLPFICRTIVFISMRNKTLPFLLNEFDWVAFGLVLHITNINELEHIKLKDKAWKTIQNGISISFIAIYSVIFTASLIQTINYDLFDIWIIKISSILLSVSSFIVSFSIYDRLSKMKL